MTLFASSRARRIFGGWSANIVQLLLALTQQIVLIPLFLKFWTGDTLSAWLTIFAAGNLVLAADAGLHAWSLNRFLSFKSRDDCDRRTSRYYGAVFQLFVWFTALFAVLLLAIFGLIAPSKVLGFSAEPGFDLAFADHDAGHGVHAARESGELALPRARTLRTDRRRAGVGDGGRATRPDRRCHCDRQPAGGRAGLCGRTDWRR